GIDPLSLETLDEQKLLDWLGRPSAGGAGEETTLSPVILRIGESGINLTDQTFVHGKGRAGQLTRTQAAPLGPFLGSPCRILSGDELRRAVVGHGVEPYERSVDMLIARLRRKIEPNPKTPRFILCVPGVGYKFPVKPQTAENGNAPSAVLPKEGGPLSPAGQGIASRHSEPERRQLTVLSCTLVGLATLAGGLEPEDLAGIAQRFQEICTTVITNWGGAVVNVVGDELLAMFGYP